MTEWHCLTCQSWAQGPAGERRWPEAHLGWWTWGSLPEGQAPADGEELFRTTQVSYLNMNRTEVMATPPIFPRTLDRAPPQDPRDQ